MSKGLKFSSPELRKSYLEHAGVLGYALRVFRKRNDLRKDLWREHGAEEALRNAQAKASRVAHILETHDESSLVVVQHEVEDDLIDLVNYAVFALRSFHQRVSDLPLIISVAQEKRNQDGLE